MAVVVEHLPISVELAAPPVPEPVGCGGAALTAALHRAVLGPAPPRLWVYVPDKCQAPSQDFPILIGFGLASLITQPMCQTYVDTVLHGCLEWGGAALAREWAATTFGWSAYFLNDAPLSRRPWLHRPRHTEIDEVLLQNESWTRFSERRHPEDFAVHWTAGIRGMWGVPPRNPGFVGRARELEQIGWALSSADASGTVSAGVTTIETVGLGGVGKTQLAAEYCHRRYQAQDGRCAYGLVVWLAAESSDSIAAGLRDLAADCGIAVKDMHNEQVVEEVRSRLFRSGCRWLLVFDNLEDRGVLDLYVPRGGFVAGHVLVTTRVVVPGVPQDRRIAVDCFSPEESLNFLSGSVGAHALESVADPGGGTASAGAVLAEALGHLPLAMAMAAAYMVHCDATCSEYCTALRNSARFLSSDSHKLSSYPMGVTESLSLSLRRMSQCGEQSTDGEVGPREVLDCVCFLAPDGVTKQLVSLLAHELRARRREPAGQGPWWLCTAPWPAHAGGVVAFAVAGASLAAALAAIIWRRRTARGRLAVAIVACMAAARCAVQQGQAALDGPLARAPSTDSLRRQPSWLSDVSLEADRIWTLLKQYSLLAVRDRTGSMHRLLQQLLRDLQGEEQSARSLTCCVAALRSLWAFDPADTTTWAEAGKLVEHAKAVGRHTDLLLGGGGGRRRISPVLLHALRGAADLLTDVALYMSMALSRFDEANAELEIATRFHKFHLPGGLTAVSADLARTLHTRGQVARYRGKLREASANLDAALEMRRSLSRQAEPHLWDVASTLHETGILRLRQQLPEAAEALLRESLGMKRSLRARSVPPPLARQHRFSDEAATLHQLAVAAMSAKPSRLDEAEGLLLEALAAEASDNPFGRGARAASLQQLARVQMRRGRLVAARGNLQEALALHQEAYGKDTPHVNLVAVRTQLGKVACELALKTGGSEAAPLLEESTGHLLEALCAQRRIYCGGRAGPGEPDANPSASASLESDRPEIAATLGQLGVVQRGRKCLSSAQWYFSAQREMLSRLVGAGCGQGPLRPSIDGAPGGPASEQLLRQLLAAMQWEKTTSRELGEVDRSKRLTEDMKAVSRALRAAGAAGGRAEPEPTDGGLQEGALCRACVGCREAVREALLEARKTGRGLPEGFCAAQAAGLAAAARRSEAEEGDGAQGGAALLRAAAAEFCSALLSQGDDKFQACDDMRSALRQLGVRGAT
ncbi:unnamed protein product [Prorocentrum cordatum]|uniref:NB-ARC domain-containing protein n=1 Tax=Prorocentrum cordatum TaxID=2364126 RepID=A0ABN9W9C0_9DINO|nr:unnamed protein product [Polarella glacialis]